MRRYDDAMAAVDRSLALNPEASEYWGTKGEILNALRRYQDALLCLDRAIALDPSLAEIWHDRAMAHRGLGHTDEAEAAERRARELGWAG
jgi:tetratricopeptide (TPR) repeat protein